MTMKKKESAWMEPYNILKMLGAAARLVLVAFKSGFQQVASNVKEVPEEIGAKDARYALIEQELQQIGALQAWHRFLITGMLIEIFLFTFSVMHFMEGNWFIGLELLLMTVIAIVLFGYKPWIVRNKKYVSFATYLRVFKSDIKALGLWYSYKALE